MGVTVTSMLLSANPCCRRPLTAFNRAGNWRRRLSSINNTRFDREECDIVIVGGGPAGLALAAALGEFGPSIRNPMTYRNTRFIAIFTPKSQYHPCRSWRFGKSRRLDTNTGGIFQPREFPDKRITNVFEKYVDSKTYSSYPSYRYNRNRSLESCR